MKTYHFSDLDEYIYENANKKRIYTELDRCAALE